MYIKILRTTLVLLEALVGVSALAGGIALLTGIIQFPTDWVQAMPFGSQVVPGLVLAIIVGGSALVAVWLAVISYARDWMASLAAGFFLVCFEIIEVAVEPQVVWLQLLFLGIGVVIIMLAALLSQAEISRPAQITPIPEEERQPISSGSK